MEVVLFGEISVWTKLLSVCILCLSASELLQPVCILLSPTLSRSADALIHPATACSRSAAAVFLNPATTRRVSREMINNPKFLWS